MAQEAVQQLEEVHVRADYDREQGGVSRRRLFTEICGTSTLKPRCFNAVASENISSGLLARP